MKTGEYVPVGVINDRLVYHKQSPDANGEISTLRYDVAIDRWVFDNVQSPISVGDIIFGSNIEPLNLNFLGQFNDCKVGYMNLKNSKDMN